MGNRPRTKISSNFSALGCALAEGRTAISVGREPGNRKDNRNKLYFAVAHCRWGKIGVRRNCCTATQMSRNAAIHRTFGVIGRRG